MFDERLPKMYVWVSLSLAGEQSRETGGICTQATRMTTKRSRTRVLIALRLRCMNYKGCPFPQESSRHFTAIYSPGPYPWSSEQSAQVHVAALAGNTERVGLMSPQYMQKVWEITQDSELQLLVNFMLHCLPIASRRSLPAYDLSEAGVSTLVFCPFLTFSDPASQKSDRWPICFFQVRRKMVSTLRKYIALPWLVLAVLSNDLSTHSKSSLETLYMCLLNGTRTLLD